MFVRMQNPLIQAILHANNYVMISQIDFYNELKLVSFLSNHVSTNAHH